jgi:hypothetical protein
MLRPRGAFDALWMELGLIQFLTFHVRDRWVCISWKRRSCRGASVPDWLASWRLKSRDGIDEPPFAVRAFGRSRQASSGLLREVWRQRPFPRLGVLTLFGSPRRKPTGKAKPRDCGGAVL